MTGISKNISFFLEISKSKFYVVVPNVKNLVNHNQKMIWEWIRVRFDLVIWERKWSEPICIRFKHRNGRFTKKWRIWQKSTPTKLSYEQKPNWNNILYVLLSAPSISARFANSGFHRKSSFTMLSIVATHRLWDACGKRCAAYLLRTQLRFSSDEYHW